MATSLIDTIDYIASRADADDLDRVLDAIKQRRHTLGSIRAAAIKVGSEVRIDGISPKYLIGLTGTVTSTDGKRATVTLDKESTLTLRFTRQTRFHIRDDQDTYPLSGIPLQCCHLSDTAAQSA